MSLRKMCQPILTTSCAHFNPMNSSVYDDMLEKLLNGILKGQNSVEEIVEAVKKMPKHRREM